MQPGGAISEIASRTAPTWHIHACLSDEDWPCLSQATSGTNLFFSCQVLPAMIAKQSGTILLTGATASLRGGASFATLGEYPRTPVVADCNLEELSVLRLSGDVRIRSLLCPQSSLWFITFPLCPTAVGKFALRALGQSLAREFHPQGIHVAHILVDGQIKSERYSVLSRQTFYLGKICSYVQPGSQAFNGSFGPKHGLSGYVPTWG